MQLSNSTQSHAVLCSVVRTPLRASFFPGPALSSVHLFFCAARAGERGGKKPSRDCSGRRRLSVARSPDEKGKKIRLFFERKWAGKTRVRLLLPLPSSSGIRVASLAALRFSALVTLFFAASSSGNARRKQAEEDFRPCLLLCSGPSPGTLGTFRGRKKRSTYVEGRQKWERGVGDLNFEPLTTYRVSHPVRSLFLKDGKYRSSYLLPRCRLPSNGAISKKLL